MKFAFLLALLIALVAVSSAAWTLTAPVTGDVWTPGSVVTVKLQTDTGALKGGRFTLTSTSRSNDIFWDQKDDWAVNGAGAFAFWTIGTAETPIADRGQFSGGPYFELLADVAAGSEISLKVRVSHLAVDEITLSLPQPVNPVSTFQEQQAASVTVTIAASAPVVTVVSASANEDRSTNVELKFSGLLPNSVFGPVTFGYQFDDGVQSITSDPLFTAQFLASDFAPVVFGKDVRLLFAYPDFWIVTGAAPADSTITLQYFDYELGELLRESERNKDYSVWATIKDSKKVPHTSSKVVGKVQANTRNIARIERDDAGQIRYSHSLVAANDKPTWTFSLSGFNADDVFTSGATLEYYIGNDGSAKKLDFSAKKFEYELTDAKAGDLVSVGGVFITTGEFTQLTKFESAIDGRSASAQLVIRATISGEEIGSLTDGVIDYTFQILRPYSFKGPFAYLTTVKHFLEQGHGDIRAAGEYTPTCTSPDGASVSVGDKLTEDGTDLSIRKLTIKGTIAADNRTGHTIKCTQKVGTGPRSAKYVSLGQFYSKDLFTVADSKTYKQKITIYADPITDSAAFNTLLDHAIAELKKSHPTKFDQLVVADFHYVDDTSIQHYSTGYFGLDFKFDTFSDEYSNQSSRLQLAFTPTGADETYQPARGNLYGDGWKYILQDSPTTAFSAPAVYLDGSVDATYTANQFVPHGFGVKCATTEQCSTGAYCNKGVCIQHSKLTFAQQAAIVEHQSGSDDEGGPDDQDDSGANGSSALFTGFALLLASITLFA